MKIQISLLAIFIILLSACSINSTANQTQEYVDDLGRTVTIPVKIDKVAASGNPAQLLIYSFKSDLLVGWASRPSGAQKKYISRELLKLPEFGAFYGKNSNLNSEALVAAAPQLIIDFGERKDGIAEDLDRLQSKIGIPVIFIEGDIDAMGNAYRRLGMLFNDNKRAETLANYCESTIAYFNEKKQLIKNPVKLYYGEGDKGLNAIAAGNIHGRVIEMIGAVNVADIPKINGTGGSLIDAEQLLNWQPSLIIVNGENTYSSVSSDDVFKSLGVDVYRAPDAFYNWMGRPPSINQMMGMYWLGNLIYPDVYDYRLYDKAREFYQLFYHYELSEKAFKSLIK